MATVIALRCPASFPPFVPISSPSSCWLRGLVPASVAWISDGPVGAYLSSVRGDVLLGEMRHREDAEGQGDWRCPKEMRCRGRCRKVR
jgi:hypothetical protein